MKLAQKNRIRYRKSFKSLSPDQGLAWMETLSTFNDPFYRVSFSLNSLDSEANHGKIKCDFYWKQVLNNYLKKHTDWFITNLLVCYLYF